MPKHPLARYIIIGAAAYLLEIVSLYDLRSGLGLSPIAAVAISFWIGFVAAFWLQKLITFRNYDKSRGTVSRQLAGYSLLVAWNYVFTLLMVRLLADHFSVYVVRTAVILIVTSWNFLAYRKLFAEVAKPKKSAIKPKKPAKKLSAAAKKAATKEAKHPLNTLVMSPLFAKVYAWTSVIVLLVTTLIWSLLGARVQSGNADQLVDTYLFENQATLRGAQFPGQHTMLLKWPLFWLVKLFGSSASAFATFTVVVTVLTVAGLAFVLYRIERRKLVFGTLCLALASCLLLVPSQPYAGGILPVNMAMLTTRNLEYIVYIASLALLARAPKFRDWRFLASITLLSILLASDKLFLSLSLGGGLMACIAYVLGRKWSLASLAARWLVSTLLAAGLAAGLIWLINFSRLTHIASESVISPYGFAHSIKDLGLGAVYAASGLLSNFGANPATDTRIIRQVPSQLHAHLLSLSGVNYVINVLLLIGAIFMVYRLLSSSLFHTKHSHLHVGGSSKLSLMLIWASMSAVFIFIASNHYYPVDARYLTIVVFAVFISVATFASKRAWHAGVVMACGLVFMLGIFSGLPAMASNYQQEQAALADINNRNLLVAQALGQRPLDLLVGDYWRVFPIKLAAKNQLNVMPLSGCGQTRRVLSSQVWQPDLNQHSFTYLLSLDSSLTNYHNCSLDDVINEYGRPNASTVIAGTFSQPKELLLFYDRGAHASSPKLSPVSVQGPATVVPIGLEDLPHTTCTVPTIMNIVAHEDDDLLFMSPDLVNDIKAKRCIRTIYLTAGDAGSDKFYSLSRERGSEAAYSNMLGTSDIWIQRIVKLADNQYITIANPRNNATISLIFMHLPDGNLKGNGFRASSFESLARLEKGETSVLHAVDGQSAYSSSQLTDALTILMHTYEPAEIHTQADHRSPIYPDHSDHMAAGHFAKRAHMQYEHEHFEDRLNIPIIYYMGYPVHQLPENVLGEALLAKTRAFLAYSKYDNSVCHSAQECNHTTVYGTYLKRQYRVPMQP